MTIKTLTKRIALLEGKKVNLPIAQISETLRCLKALCHKSFEAYLCFDAYVSNDPAIKRFKEIDGRVRKSAGKKATIRKYRMVGKNRKATIR